MKVEVEHSGICVSIVTETNNAHLFWDKLLKGLLKIL